MKRSLPLAIIATALGGVLAAPDSSAQVPLGSEWGRLLAKRRAMQIKIVHDYAMRGRFPINEYFPSRKPIFIDSLGTPCAVAHLMIESGHGEMARAVATNNNHVRVAGLRAGPVVDWILTSGLLQEEAARIQPSYEFDPAYRARRDRHNEESTRIHEHLLRVEQELLRDNEKSLTLAEQRLDERAGKSPKFAAELERQVKAEATEAARPNYNFRR